MSFKTLPAEIRINDIEYEVTVINIKAEKAVYAARVFSYEEALIKNKIAVLNIPFSFIKSDMELNEEELSTFQILNELEPENWNQTEVKKLVDFTGGNVRKFCKLTGLRPNSVGEWINGKRSPSLTSRHALDSIAYRCGLKYLY